MDNIHLKDTVTKILILNDKFLEVNSCVAKADIIYDILKIINSETKANKKFIGGKIVDDLTYILKNMVKNNETFNYNDKYKVKILPLMQDLALRTNNI